ncbi:hypothetical protein PG985_005504 [Apiospora marii]|uniref:uncharacterized protein n=1 Tax=Apiospora marii TaxID=335849 RepID=UPI003132360A
MPDDCAHRSMECNRGNPPAFESLATDILLCILFYIPNLETLCNLVSASPRSRRLFQTQAPALFEAALDGPNCDGLLARPVRELVRAVVFVRTLGLPFHTLDKFRYGFLVPKFYSRRSSTAIGSITDLQVDFDPAMLLSVLSTHSHINRLTHACLASYLARVRGPQFRPQYCPDAVYTFGCGPEEVQWLPAWKRSFVGKPMKKSDAGPPSWVEEMRVKRALWLLQLIGDLQRAVLQKDGATRTRWPSEDMHMFLKMAPEDFIEPSNLAVPSERGAFEEILSVKEFLQSLRTNEEKPTVRLGNIARQYHQLPRPPAEAMSETLATPLPERVEWLIGGQALGPDTRKEPGRLRLRELYKQRKPERSEARRWGQTPSCLFEEAPGVQLWLKLTSTSQLHMEAHCAWPKARFHNSPLAGVRFDSFRRLGFAIWDRKRMHLLGLVNGTSSIHLDEECRYFTWESLLSTEEVVAVKAALGDPYPGGLLR